MYNNVKYSRLSKAEDENFKLVSVLNIFFLRRLQRVKTS
jgi:hypothetical protein